jgi:hypothetical protein
VKVNSGNWYVVREIDKLPWNVFQNAVQAHIRSKSIDFFKNEELIDLYDENNELIYNIKDGFFEFNN